MDTFGTTLTFQQIKDLSSQLESGDLPKLNESDFDNEEKKDST